MDVEASLVYKGNFRTGLHIPLLTREAKAQYENAVFLALNSKESKMRGQMQFTDLRCRSVLKLLFHMDKGKDLVSTSSIKINKQNQWKR